MAREPHGILMPTDVSSRIGLFDRFAGYAAHLASRAPFFAFCLLLVVAWLVHGVVLIVSKGSIRPFLSSEYQLEINTTTTIITFLMVALLQNSHPERPGDPAQAECDRRRPRRPDGAHRRTVPRAGLTDDMRELRAAVGLETREGTSKDTAGPSAGAGAPVGSAEQRPRHRPRRQDRMPPPDHATSCP